MFRRATHVVHLWSQDADTAEHVLGVEPSRQSIIPNARDGSYFRPPTPAERSAAQNALGGPSHPNVVVIGALTEEKRVDLALRGCDIAGVTRAIVVGDGPLRSELAALVGSLANVNVAFVGGVDDVRPFLWGADAIVITSRTEGMPGVAIEADLCGVPVVATDVGAMRSMFDAGCRGVLLAADPSAADVGKALNQALSLAPISERAVVSPWQWEQVIPMWERVLDSVVGDTRPRRRSADDRSIQRGK